MKRNIKVYPASVVAHGWTKLEDCFCGGIYKIKFEHADYPGYILEWWVDHYRIKMTRNRSSYSGQILLKNADAYLSNFAVDQEAKAAVDQEAAKKAPAPASVPVLETVAAPEMEKIEAVKVHQIDPETEKATDLPKDKTIKNEVTSRPVEAVPNSTPRKKSRKKKATK